MLLNSLIPTLPASTAEIILYVAAYLSAIMVIYSIFVEAEHRRDLIRVVAGSALLIYAWYVENLVFMITFGGIALASAVEFAEIYLGLHHHSRADLEQYKKLAFPGRDK